MALIDSNLLRKPGLAKKVLALLNALQPLPSVGVVAGQAVASAIDAILGTGHPVFNDLDVFIDERDWPESTILVLSNPRNPQSRLIPKPHSERWKSKLTATLTYTGNMGALTQDIQFRADDADEYREFSTQQNIYSVKKTERDGLVNKVMVSYTPAAIPFNLTKAKLRIRAAQTLILGFDINSTQVAINLSNGKMNFTAEFERYFASRQLQIVRLFTPVQTILRYFKKREELKAYGDDDLALRMFALRMKQTDPSEAFSHARVQAFKDGLVYWPRAQQTELYNAVQMDVSGPIGSGLQSAPLVMGPKYKAVLDAYGHKIAELVMPVAHPKKDLWLMATTAAAQATRLRTLVPVSAALLTARFQEESAPLPKGTQNRLALFDAFVSGLSPSLAKKYLEQYRKQGHAYLEGIESPLRTMLSKLVVEHSELERPVVGLPFRFQIQFIQQAKLAMKRVSTPKLWSAFSFKGTLWAHKAIGDPGLIDSLLIRLAPTDKPLVPALPLPAVIDGVAVKELVSGLALLGEGERMAHCVGGYQDHLIRERSRIISLQHGPERTERSTTQWDIAQNADLPVIAKEGRRSWRPLKVNLVQSRTYRNARSSVALLAAEQSLREYVNKWLADNPLEGWQILQRSQVPELERALSHSSG